MVIISIMVISFIDHTYSLQFGASHTALTLVHTPGTTDGFESTRLRPSPPRE
jgi:hypothetical protein